MASSGPPPPDGDYNLGPGIVQTVTVLMILSVIVVALRFAIRIWIVKKVWWDDWTILFALVRLLSWIEGCFQLLNAFGTVWDCDWNCIGLCWRRLRFWQTSVLPLPVSALPVSEIFMG